MAHRFRRPVAVGLAAALCFAACGGDDDTTADTTATDGDATTTTSGPATTEPTTTTTEPPPPPTTEPVVTTEPPPPPTTAPAPPPTTAAPTTTEPAFMPAETITLDDPQLAVEPPDVSYRAQLTMTMRRELSDGTVQLASLVGDGGKLVDPAVQHAMVIDLEPVELLTIPVDCADIAAMTPGWISAYDTFSGSLGGDEGGDLTGEAALSEVGIMSNGVLVDRYAITMDNIKPENLDEYETLDLAHIDIARDGGFVVGIVLNGLGRNNTFSIDQSEPREITYELNFSEFGTFEQFQIPAGCQEEL